MENRIVEINKTGIATLVELSSFFETEIPNQLIPINNTSTIKLIDNEKIREIISETDPQLYIEKAALVSFSDEKIIFTIVRITEKMCAGHFNFFPMVPLALLGQAGAQAGSILISIITDSLDKTEIPIAVRVNDIRMTGNKNKNKHKNFIVPGDNLIITATYNGGKFNFHKTSIEMFVDGSTVCIMDKISYIVVEKNYFKV